MRENRQLSSYEMQIDESLISPGTITFLLSSSRRSSPDAEEVDDISIVVSLLLLTFDDDFGLLQADSSELFCETPSLRKRRNRIYEMEERRDDI